MTHHLVGMAEIAEILGVTRQRVAQLIETYEDFPQPEVELTGGRIWSRTAIETWVAAHPDRKARGDEKADARQAFSFQRFTDRARKSIVGAQEEARLMNHNYIGTEHLLLGLINIGEGLAFNAVTSLGLTLERVRAQVVDMIGKGAQLPHGHIPFTPRAKTALEKAMSEALSLGHNYIGTEHILLGAIGDETGVAAQALTALGHPAAKVREAVLAVMTGATTAVPTSTAEAIASTMRDLVDRMDALKKQLDELRPD